MLLRLRVRLSSACAGAHAAPCGLRRIQRRLEGARMPRRRSRRPFDPAPANASGAAPGADGYYVEFRARMASIVTGHAYIVYGPQDENGKPLEENIAGFLPRTTTCWAFSAAWSPRPARWTRSSSTGKPEAPRHLPQDADGRRISRSSSSSLRRPKKEKKVWNMFFANCNDFAGRGGQGGRLESAAGELHADARLCARHTRAQSVLSKPRDREACPRIRRPKSASSARVLRD